MPKAPPPAAAEPSVSLSAPWMVALLVVPVKMEEPSGAEVDLAQASEPRNELPDRLPSAASPMPFVGLLGFLSLTAAAAVRFGWTVSSSL